MTMQKYQITTQQGLRNCFWNDHPDLKRHSGWSQNDYPADTRMAFCDYVEQMSREGIIGEALAQKATL